MISHKAQSNLNNLLYGLHCKIEHDDIISFYDFDRGVYAIKDNGKYRKRENIFMDTSKMGKDAAKEFKDYQYQQYKSHLKDCITAFEKKIEENILELSSEKEHLYLLKIKDDLENFIRAKQDIINNLKFALAESRKTSQRKKKYSLSNRNKEKIKKDIRLYEIQIELLTPFVDWVRKKTETSMNIEQIIFHYKEKKWCIPFRELHHTVVTVCEFMKPIYPTIEPLKYIEYFFKEIDFDKIDNNPNKTETLKYCNAIYYGLEQLLKGDIDKAILNYQNNISNLTKEQISETQNKLIVLIGNLKRQARTNEAGISFTQRYNKLYKSIETKEKLLPIDYMILISLFNETILNDLLSTYEIILQTLKEIAPKKTLPQETKSKVLHTSFKLEKSDFKKIADVLDVLHSNALVSSKVKVPQFKQAFKDGIVKNEIEWIGGMAALHFFIDKICERIKNDTKNSKWKTTNKCFFIEGKDLTKLPYNKEPSKKDKENILKAIGKFQ